MVDDLVGHRIQAAVVMGRLCNASRGTPSITTPQSALLPAPTETAELRASESEKSRHPHS
jgi:hypothetical protein